MTRFIVTLLVLASCNVAVAKITLKELVTGSEPAAVQTSIFTPKKKTAVPDNVRVRMRAFLAAEASIVSLKASAPGPNPAPAPDKKGVCTYCDGSGKSGDGLNVCAHCGGSGKEPKSMTMEEMLEQLDMRLDTKLSVMASQLQSQFRGQLDALKPKELPKPKEQPKPKVVAMPHYPVRGGWWTGCPDWQHLTRGEHNGKFDQTWLRSLSNAEVQSLHSDDHEGHVKWEYAVRPQPVQSAPPAAAPPAPKAKPAVKFYFAPQRRGNCPGGFCPASIQTVEVTEERGYVIVESYASN